MSGKMKTIYLYTRYERFWHWFQMAMIVTLIVTGLEIHDLFAFLGFETAVEVHNFVGLTWLIASDSSLSGSLPPESGSSIYPLVK